MPTSIEMRENPEVIENICCIVECLTCSGTKDVNNVRPHILADYSQHLSPNDARNLAEQHRYIYLTGYNEDHEVVISEFEGNGLDVSSVLPDLYQED